MICILKMNTMGEIVGWIIAHDTFEAYQTAHGAGEKELAAALRQKEAKPASGKYEISPGYLMLVS